MNRRPLLVVGGWLLTAAIATGAGVVVTTFLGDAVTGSATRALSPADVRRSLDASARPAGPSPSAPSPSEVAPSRPAASPSSSPQASPSGGESPRSGHSGVIATRGGVVVARCEDGGLVRSQSWTPAQGYEVKDAERGPRDKVRVRFEGETRVEIEIRCSGGRPVHTVKTG
ncbi:hypothetical protein [Sphaerisporangium dianthi]|uniref:Septum formation initiator n=1 Tax=Sphaerisporangium dianthi TaxID=1436120 RepID=A0ABV9C9M6_9ACTN